MIRHPIFTPAYILLAFSLVFALPIHGGIARMEAHPGSEITLTIMPDKAFFRPGEPATFTVTASGGARVVGTITHLADTIASVESGLVNGSAALSWQPPNDAPCGYGLTVQVLDDNGTVLAQAATAFDVLEHWLQAPRYGFLSDFEPGRDNADGTMVWAARQHINGLQFYDWQYRHEALMPPQDIYTDLLGKQMSLPVIRDLIAAAHARNIAAMPYTAIYGASPAFYEQHPDWALFMATDVPYDFADGYLYIMDPSPDSPWSEHLLSEFAAVLEQTAFDGIHLDQYGAPKSGRNHDGQPVDLAEAFPAFIDRAAAVVQSHRGASGAMIFNAVGNWPVDTVAPADQDAVYIEVWAPYRDFLDLHRIVVNAEQLGGGKPVIIAAYIHPNNVHNVRLANAMINASGAYHLELGEPGAMLADPYFPKFGMMDEAMQATMQRTYDFLVRYEEVLAVGAADATATRAAALTIPGVATAGLRAKNRVVVIVREGPHREAFSLVNFRGVGHSRWAEPLFDGGPEPQLDLPVTLRVERPVTRVWLASPDDDARMAPQIVDFTAENDADGATITFTVPRLDYWTMLVVEYGS